MKSSYSASNQNCVDVTLDTHGRVLVRHSRQLEPGQPCVSFTREEWETFLLGVNAYEFEYRKLPQAGGVPVTPPGRRS